MWRSLQKRQWRPDSAHFKHFSGYYCSRNWTAELVVLISHFACVDSDFQMLLLNIWGFVVKTVLLIKPTASHNEKRLPSAIVVCEWNTCHTKIELRSCRLTNTNVSLDVCFRNTLSVLAGNSITSLVSLFFLNRWTITVNLTPTGDVLDLGSIWLQVGCFTKICSSYCSNVAGGKR